VSLASGQASGSRGGSTPTGTAAVRDLTQRALRYARIDLAEAESAALAACDLASTLDAPAASGLAHRSLAHVRYLTSRFEEAIELYDRSVAEFLEGADELEAAKTRSSALQSLILLGRYERAEQTAAEARSVFERHGDDTLLARLDINVGNLLHRLDRHQEALDKYERSLQFFRLRGGDPQATAAALLNSAVCLIILGRLDAALARFGEVSAHCRAHDMPLPALQADYNVAYLHFHRGEYTRAIELYRAAADQAHRLGDRYHQALCQLDLSEIYLEVNLVDEAMEYLTAAQAAFAALGMRYESSKATTFLAIGESMKHRLMRAASLFADARSGFEAEGNRAWCAMVDFHQAAVLLEAGRAPEALRLASRARDLFAQGGQSRRAVLAELLLARAHLALGAVAAAREQVDAALGRLEDQHLPHLTYQAFHVAGQVAEASHDPSAALGRYRAAGALLSSLRSHLHSEELQIAFARDKQKVYESLVWLGLDRGGDVASVAEAFAWVESAKSRALADMIAPRAPLPASSRGDASALARRMRRLREELNWYYSQLDAADFGRAGEADPALLGGVVTPERADEYRRRTRRFEDRLIRIMSRVRSRDLELDALHGGGAIGLDAIRQALPEGGLLIEYYEARGTVFAFVVGRDRLEAHAVSTSERVRRVQGYLQFQLSKQQLGGPYLGTFAEPLLRATQAHLRDLWRELIAPLAPLDATRIVVVPHGPLHRVPFHALWDGEAYLVDRCALTYAPSASISYLCATRAPRPSRGALVLGVPDPENPGIADEARAVAAALPGARLLIGDEVTVEALRELGPGARHVHIAAHGLFRRDNPMFSAIQLGSSRLTLFDLYELDLASDVVVLSGCGTGLAVIEGGDEIIGLVRGLLHAGAQSVVATLWDAHDASTARFMELFYRHLLQSGDRASALRHAMLELRATHPHPFFWAPFFLAGAPGAAPTPIGASRTGP
jgi:CHAT domain-containing protein/tetratricopeptide (TPR) repeat protein